ncbi:MAG: RNA polymerase sigma factor [Actinomycetota bacterium]|nr:RNA polymerase sigma factor [Actinomycetota bacterium]
MDPDGDIEAPQPEPPRLRSVGQDSYADWDEVYVDNVSRIYPLMYAKVGNRPDAEDLTAEVFLAALGPLRLGASRGEVRAYLLTTARTVLAGYWRRRLGVQITTIDPDSETRSGDEPGCASNARDRAERILATLPDRSRRILQLRFLFAMSVKEAAREMDVSVANAKVLQHRALRLAAKAAGAEG